MSEIKYCFYEISFIPINYDKMTGDKRLLLDIKDQIIERLGPPAYPENHEDALSDAKTLLIGINNNAFLPPVDKSRWLGICAANDHYNDPSYSQIVLEPTFNYPNFIRHDEIEPGATILPIHALPSRVTPDAIKQAKNFYDDKIHIAKGPITTFVIGDLSWNEWNSKKLIKAIKKLMSKRGGAALVTTCPRTQEKDEAALTKTLKKWSVHFYNWRQAQKIKEENPYLAMFGAADEICLTGDSLSVISDVLKSGKPFRIIHDPAAEPEIIEPADRLTARLVANGAKTIFDHHDIMPPIRFDTGIHAAMDTVCAIIKDRCAKLTP